MIDTKEIEDSINNDDLLNRLEKLSTFLEEVVYHVTQDEISSNDVSKVIEHIKIQKCIYDSAHSLYYNIKEESVDKEGAYENMKALKGSLEEYKKFKEVQ